MFRKLGVGCSLVGALALMTVTGAQADRPLHHADHRTEAPRPDPRVDPVPPHGQSAQGLYFNSTFVRRFGPSGIISALRRARMSAAVIDVKDITGNVFLDTDIPEFQATELPYRGRATDVAKALRAADVYTSGRVVCCADDLLPKARPDLAVLDSRPGRKNRPWVSWGTGTTWLDPYSERNHELVRRLAIEVERHGFEEIQLDYVRFPVDDGVRYARYPAERTDTLRRHVLADMLRRLDEAVRIPISVDVFGMSSLHEGDPSGLGQSLEEWVDHVEAFSPMLYINGHEQWRRRLAQKRAETLVRTGSYLLRRRIGPKPVIRPFLQAFSAGSDYFDTEFIREQIRGARDGHADGFLFWHPGSSYGLVANTTRDFGRGLLSFHNEARQIARAGR
jgi:hypothetical protein